MVLRYFDDLSVPEIAKAMRKSIHAIESLLARGRDSFKRFYMESEDG
jgi:DNA-directed RNA polymerase specialized sigma24 family protein